LTAGMFFPVVTGQLLVLLLWTIAICFTWPALEALVTDGEDSQDLPRMVGIYNMVWASGASLAFFSGGALVQLLGWKSLFWLPVGLHLTQFGIASWLHHSGAGVPPAIPDLGSPHPRMSEQRQAALALETGRLGVIESTAALGSRGPLVLDEGFSGATPPSGAAAIPAPRPGPSCAWRGRRIRWLMWPLTLPCRSCPKSRGG